MYQSVGKLSRQRTDYFSWYYCNYLGGPTDEARGILDLSVQYWTSRGWSFVDVNYGGSAGICLLTFSAIYLMS